MAQTASESGSFSTAVRKLIRSGGCNCSKVNFAGACLGAAFGVFDDVTTGAAADRYFVLASVSFRNVFHHK